MTAAEYRKQTVELEQRIAKYKLGISTQERTSPMRRTLQFWLKQTEKELRQLHDRNKHQPA